MLLTKGKSMKTQLFRTLAAALATAATLSGRSFTGRRPAAAKDQRGLQLDLGQRVAVMGDPRQRFFSQIWSRGSSDLDRVRHHHGASFGGGRY